MFKLVVPPVKSLTRNVVCVPNKEHIYPKVPKHQPPDPKDCEILKEFLHKHAKILFLTGAGISTESGIPDYRSEEVGLYARSNHKPVQYQDFIKYPKVRQRYWARNFMGWPRFSIIEPNITHLTITELQKVTITKFCEPKKTHPSHHLTTISRQLNLGKVTSIVTQNVDRLHHKAGSSNIIELHGTGYIVKCLSCPYEVDRHTLQEELLRKNPQIKNDISMIRPDGDVELSQEQAEKFKTPLCPKCESPLKPDIIFFGDNVPKARVEQVRNQVSASDAIFVLGSSLTVYSSYRIILQAKEEGKEVAILNIGPTRADTLVNLKVSAKCGDILPDLCNSLS